MSDDVKAALAIADSTEEQVKDLDFGNVFWALGVITKAYRADTQAVDVGEIEKLALDALKVFKKVNGEEAAFHDHTCRMLCQIVLLCREGRLKPHQPPTQDTGAALKILSNIHLNTGGYPSDSWEEKIHNEVEKAIEALTGSTQYVDEDKTKLKRIAEIIEGVDNRAMAADGPVTPTLKEMRQDEIQEIYDIASGDMQDKPCETCNGEDELCATVPSLRRCEKANREQDTGAAYIFTEEERDGMLNAFERGQEKHGIYESLFAVASFILRKRQALQPQEVDVEILMAEIDDKVCSFEEGNEVESVARQVLDYLAQNYAIVRK
jgi:hypothetical protein